MSIGMLTWKVGKKIMLFALAYDMRKYKFLKRQCYYWMFNSSDNIDRVIWNSRYNDAKYICRGIRKIRTKLKRL